MNAVFMHHNGQMPAVCCIGQVPVVLMDVYALTAAISSSISSIVEVVLAMIMLL